MLRLIFFGDSMVYEGKYKHDCHYKDDPLRGAMNHPSNGAIWPSILTDLISSNAQSFEVNFAKCGATTKSLYEEQLLKDFDEYNNQSFLFNGSHPVYFVWSGSNDYVRELFSDPYYLVNNTMNYILNIFHKIPNYSNISANNSIYMLNLPLIIQPPAITNAFDVMMGDKVGQKYMQDQYPFLFSTLRFFYNEPTGIAKYLFAKCFNYFIFYKYNNIVETHNALLTKALDSYNDEFGHHDIILVDINKLLSDIAFNSKEYNIQNINQQLPCYYDLNSCDKLLFYDAVHLTHYANKLIASYICYIFKNYTNNDYECNLYKGGDLLPGDLSDRIEALVNELEVVDITSHNEL